MRLDGVASRGPASDVTARYSADGFAVKVNGTAVIKIKVNIRYGKENTHDWCQFANYRLAIRNR